MDNACWKDTPHDVKGKTIIVPRGAVCASERRIADDCGVGRQVVRTFLSRLTDEHMINPDVTQGRTVIRLCNYEKYQTPKEATNPAPNPRLTQDQPTKEQGNNIPVGTDAFASSFDPKKAAFDSGVALLTSGGRSDREARSLVGKWIKGHGEAEVIRAISATQRAGVVEPVSYVTGILGKQKSKGPVSGDRREVNGRVEEFIGGAWVETFE